MANKKETKTTKKKPTVIRKVADKLGLRSLDDRKCISNLRARGYGLARAKEICTKGLIKTIASDAKKVAKKAVGKLKK